MQSSFRDGLRAVALVVTVFLLPAFAAPPAPASNAPVLLVLKTLDNQFFKSIEDGVRHEMKIKKFKNPLDVRAGSQERDVAAQRQVLQAYIQRYVTGKKSPRLPGVILTPAGSADELVPEIATLWKAHVPVVLLDTQIDPAALERGHASYTLFAGSSNRNGGVKAAQIIAAKLPHGAHVLLLNGVQGAETAAERRRGFVDAISKISKPKAKFDVVEKTADWRRADAQSVVSALLSTGHKYDAIFAANDEMALGAVAAYRQVGEKRLPVIVGFDAIDEARASVNKCEMFASIAQDPFQMGVRGVDALYAEAHGAHSEKKKAVIDVVPVKCGK